MTKILVTGAAGFIGSHTTDFLLSSGHEVVGVDNLRTGCRANLKQAAASLSFDFEVMDITEIQEFARLVRNKRPAVIIHLAGLVSVQNSRADPALNLRLLTWEVTKWLFDAVISAYVSVNTSNPCKNSAYVIALATKRYNIGQPPSITRGFFS